MRGLLISGSPPVPNTGIEAIAAGFQMTQATGLAGHKNLTDDEVTFMAEVAFVPTSPAEPWAWQAVRRTDGRERETMFAHFGSGKASDQKKLSKHHRSPLQ